MASLEQYLSKERGRQAALARRLGLGAGTLSGIRSGFRRPSTELAKRIEVATDGEVRAAELLGLEEAGVAFDHHHPARPLGGGRWGATVSADGSLFLSPELVVALGFSPGEHLVLRSDGDDARINSSEKALQKLQAMMKMLVPPGVSVVDELIAERRAEAARE